ncbi:MAG: glucosidase [Nitrospiraceae bacterium]
MSVPSSDSPDHQPTAEQIRVDEDDQRRRHWKRWGPYLGERAWGTVREDYSPYGTAWEAMPHDHARSKAYRWNEDGLAGISDRHQWICFALALWNGRDPILKERLFGLTGNEGNHGEDVKEYYFYLDSTPTHSYMKWLYKYPQAAFPYDRLVAENRRRGRAEPEFELIDTGIFDGDRYFDVFVEYAKATPEDLLIRIQVENRGPEAAPITLLPTLWFRNTWSWGLDVRRPRMRKGEPTSDGSVIELNHEYYGYRRLVCGGHPEILFTENETNSRRLYGDPDGPPYVKDGINEYIVHGQKSAVNPEQIGSKAAAHYLLNVEPGRPATLRLRFTNETVPGPLEPQAFDELFDLRLREADEFYRALAPEQASKDAKSVQRQAFAGLLWTKQFYHYEVDRWLKGDPAGPEPPRQRLHGRNADWTHLYNADVISMPDKWEYPWNAAWDLAFHCLPLALVDPRFAKDQLVLMLREWYMHPNGQIPAYEWALGDVNPPVHAWATWRVYTIEKKRRGVGDRVFLERVFHKLLLNFTWWVNRKDAEGKNIFQGGFLGLDNIGVFDRSKPLPTGGHIEQSDATSWMGMYCLNMLSIALELARTDRAYEDVASKFFEHFVYICRAINNIGSQKPSCGTRKTAIRRPAFARRPKPSDEGAVDGRIDPALCRGNAGFRINRHPSALQASHAVVASRTVPILESTLKRTQRMWRGSRRFPLVGRPPSAHAVFATCGRAEFLPYGVRALSPLPCGSPLQLERHGDGLSGRQLTESATGLFGGNSNWRGLFVPRQLSVESVAPEVPLLLGRRVPRRLSNRIRRKLASAQ